MVVVAAGLNHLELPAAAFVCAQHPPPCYPARPHPADSAPQEAVEDTVLSRGGEVLLQERRLKGGLHEALKLSVCIPFLWGVPPEVDALR